MMNFIKIFGIRMLKLFALHKWANTMLLYKSGRNTIKIPVINGAGLEHVQKNEPWMEKLLEIIPFRDGFLLDAGANLGQTLRKYKLIHPSGKYIGFEPNVFCVKYLNFFIRSNQWTETYIVPKALSDKSGVSLLRFYGKQRTDSSATIIEDFRPGKKVLAEEKIEMTTWDEITPTLTKVKLDCIKIDVEGSEKEVLESLTKKITEDLPVIIIEILPVYSEKNISRLQRQTEVESLIQNWNYQIFRVRPEASDGISIHLISAIGIHSNMADVNYVLIHQSRVDEILNIISTI